MKRIAAILCMAASVLLVCVPAQAQLFKRSARVVCGPNGCYVQWQTTDTRSSPPPPTYIEVPSTEWHAKPQSDRSNGESGLLDRPKNGLFHANQPPAAQLEPWQLQGVDGDKLRGKKEEAYTCSGRWCTKIEALAAVLDDDSGKLWIIVTGDGRDNFVSDIRSSSSMSDILARSRLWVQPADHFTVTGKGYPRGNPGIFFAAADGTELYSATSYSGPADLEWIRKADPLYKPAPPSPGPTPAPAPTPSPNPLTPDQPTPSPLVPLPLLLMIALIVIGLLLSLPRRR